MSLEKEMKDNEEELKKAKTFYMKRINEYNSLHEYWNHYLVWRHKWLISLEFKSGWKINIIVIDEFVE